MDTWLYLIIFHEVAGRFICIHSAPLHMIGPGDLPPITHLVERDCARDCQNNPHHIFIKRKVKLMLEK